MALFSKSKASAALDDAAAVATRIGADLAAARAALSELQGKSGDLALEAILSGDEGAWQASLTEIEVAKARIGKLEAAFAVAERQRAEAEAARHRKENAKLYAKIGAKLDGSVAAVEKVTKGLALAIEGLHEAAKLRGEVFTCYPNGAPDWGLLEAHGLRPYLEREIYRLNGLHPDGMDLPGGAERSDLAGSWAQSLEPIPALADMLRGVNQSLKDRLNGVAPAPAPAPAVTTPEPSPVAKPAPSGEPGPGAEVNAFRKAQADAEWEARHSTSAKG